MPGTGLVDMPGVATRAAASTRADTRLPSARLNRAALPLRRTKDMHRPCQCAMAGGDEARAQSNAPASISPRLPPIGPRPPPGLAPPPSINETDNPDLDQLQLDDAYYKELGIDEEERQEGWGREADDSDPLGSQLRLDDVFEPREGLPQFLMDEAAAPAWGPEAVLLAGFRAEEVAMVRVVLDSAGGHAVRVLPCHAPVLHMRARDAVQLPEPQWEQPRPEDWGAGGGWGSQRTLLFSGLSVKAQATVVELLEENGLPPLCAGALDEAGGDRLVGDLMAAAVKEQRGRRPARGEGWEDRASAELPPIQEVLRRETQARMQGLASSLDDGSVDALFEEGGGEGEGEAGCGDSAEEMTITLDDIRTARTLKQQQQRQQQMQQQQEQERAETAAAEQAAGRRRDGGGDGTRQGVVPPPTGARAAPVVVDAEFQDSAPEGARGPVPAAPPTDAQRRGLGGAAPAPAASVDDLIDRIIGGGGAGLSMESLVERLGQDGEAQRAAAAAAAAGPEPVGPHPAAESAAEQAEGPAAAAVAAPPPSPSAGRQGAAMPAPRQPASSASPAAAAAAPLTAQRPAPGAATHTESSPDPLLAARDAIAAALRGGVDAELLRRLVDEAERGGSPVLPREPSRYAAARLAGKGLEADGGEGRAGGGGLVMTRAQLAEVAERRGLSLELLVADARAKGVTIPDE